MLINNAVLEQPTSLGIALILLADSLFDGQLAEPFESSQAFQLIQR